MPGNLEETLGLREALQLVEPEIDVLYDSPSDRRSSIRPATYRVDSETRI